VKFLQAINGNPDLYSYSCLCERSLSLRQKGRYSIYLPQTDKSLIVDIGIGYVLRCSMHLIAIPLRIELIPLDRPTVTLRSHFEVVVVVAEF